MPFIGNKPSAVPLTSADIADSIITSAKIVDGTIVNADISASAAIAGSKLSSTGFSGATTTSSAVDITLTSASTQTQNVTMTATGKAVILPNATTLTTTGTPIYVIFNNGVIPFSVKNSSSVPLINLSPSSTVVLTLISNSTSSGTWATQNGSLNISAPNFTTISSNGGNNTGDYYKVYPHQRSISLEKMTTSTFMFSYHKGTSQRDVYGVVCSYSGSTITVNSETILYDGSSTAASGSQLVMLDATTGLLIVMRASNCVAVPFTISGTTISVGTTSSTFGTANTAFNIDKPISMSSTLSLHSEASTDGSTTKKFRVIEHNGGSAPTIGTISTDTITNNSAGHGIHLSKIDATKAFCAFSGAGNDMSACVITISGTSAPTKGTTNTDATLTTTGLGDVFADSSSQFIVLSETGSAKYTVSGTTVTFVEETLYTIYGSAVPAVGSMGFANINLFFSGGFYGSSFGISQRQGDAYLPKQAGLTWTGTPYGFNLNPDAGYNMNGIELDSTTYILFTNFTGSSAFVATVLKYLG